MTGESTLEMVERHVQEAMAHIARQKEIIEELQRDGHPLAAAESLLRVFEETLRTHLVHAARLRREAQARTRL